MVYIDPFVNVLFRWSITWEYMVIVSIQNVDFLLVRMVSFVAVALVRIEIDDEEFLDPVPLLHVVSDESYVWVDAEALSTRPGRVVEATSKVDCPAFVPRYTSCLDASQRSACHWL